MKIKYPRTFHLEWSEGISSDDKVQRDLSMLEGQRVIVTEKMDGENTTMTQQHIYPRSTDSGYHPSRTHSKNMWAKINYLIHQYQRICGENMFAKHSIKYENLEDYFLVFSVWNKNMCLDWDRTKRIVSSLGLKCVPVLYDGIFDLNTIKVLKIDTSIQEGYVIRLAKQFEIQDFNKCVLKWVRANHVSTNEHWSRQEIEKNKLKK